MTHEDYIYNKMIIYDPALRLVPKEDAMQEIRIAIFLSTKDYESEFKKAARLINSLKRDYGFSRKKGKDNFLPFYSHDCEYDKRIADTMDEIEDLYIKRGLTCRQVCEYFGVQYTPRIQKAIHMVFPKGLSHGGDRRSKSFKKLGSL